MEQFSYKNYTYSSFFEHYYKTDPNNPIGSTPEQILIEYKPLLPTYIDTIINFGCSNGRDFIPFQDEYNCIGFDLAPLNYIDWVCKTTNLTYYQCSIEDYLLEFNHTDRDLSNILVYTQGTLMYLHPDNQNRFIQHLLDHNCKNMIFHEYPPEYKGPHTNFNPDKKYLDLFEKKNFRKDLTGFIYLN